MKWPFDRKAGHKEPSLLNRFYLNAPPSENVDHAFVWGTEIDADALKTYLIGKNRNSEFVVTSSHAVIKAVGLALGQFPEINVRIVGRKLYPLSGNNVRMAYLHKRSDEIDIMLVHRADTKSLERISYEVWYRLLESGRGDGVLERDRRRLRRIPPFLLRRLLRLYDVIDRNVRLPSFGRLDSVRSACAMVNDLSFAGAPPMRAFKPSRFPDNSDLINVTVGPAEAKMVLRDGAPVSVNVMPLFLRADHRVVDAYRGGKLLSFIRDTLNNPTRLDGGTGPFHKDA